MCEGAGGGKEDRVFQGVGFYKRLHLADFVIGDRENHKAFVVKLRVEWVEIRHFFAAGRAPGRPEVDQHYFAALGAQLALFAVEVVQREIGGGAARVFGRELLQGRRKWRRVQRHVHVLVTDQLREGHVLPGRAVLFVGSGLLAQDVRQRGGNFLERFLAEVAFGRQGGQAFGPAELGGTGRQA